MPVTDAADVTIDLRRLPDAEYIEQEVEAGCQTIRFEWTEDATHNVWEFRNKAAFDKCDFEHAYPLTFVDLADCNPTTLPPGSTVCSMDVTAPGVGEGINKRYFGSNFPVSTNTDCNDNHMKIKVSVVSEV